MLRFFLALTVLLASPARAEQTSNDSELFEVTDHNLVVVHFDEGKAELSASERGKLLTAVDEAKKSSKINGILVAAWADKDYPQTRDQTLTRDDEHLAKGRLDNVKAALKDAKSGVRVRTFSMALYPSWLSRTFRSDDAKLKQAVPEPLGGKSRDDLALEFYGKMLRDKGGPATAVVVIRDRDLTAH